jgi:hypothetical protein
VLHALIAEKDPDHDRRRLPRARLHVPVAFRRVASAPPSLRRGVTLDVSRSGVRFRSDEFLPMNAFVALELTLAGRAGCAARGRVVWARQARDDGHWEIGAEFLRADGDADAALAEALLFSS